MKKSEMADKDLVIDILCKSFEQNQSVNYIIKHGNQQQQALRALMNYSFDICYLFGDVWLSDDRKACALVLYPHQKRTSLKAILLDIKLIINAVGISGVKKALDRESKIKAKQPQEPMAYLWFIGVEPSEQHTGIGSKLLQEVLADAKTKALTVFLETSTEKNIPWYERFGFKIYDQLQLMYTLYFLSNKE